MKFIYRNFVALLIILLVSSCAVGPDYKKPTNEALNIPSKWHATLPHNGSNLQMINWWGQFHDNTLTFFLESSLNYSPSVFQAIAKIQQAQANLRGSRSFLYPSVTGTGSASVNKNALQSFTIGSTTNNGSAGNIFTNNGLADGYSAGANASWEIDLFGATRRAIEGSQARYQASKQDWNDAKVSLASEVADVYVSTRECQNLLDTYREELKSRTSTAEVTALRVKAGFAALTDNNQAYGSLYQNNTTLEQQNGICEKFKNQLVALTGISHEVIESKLMESYGVIPLPEVATITTLPATIINQRPDVASAEFNLAAANADVGVAVANRYPQVSLTGSINVNAGQLYANQPTSWSLGPSISIPFTDGGYLRAQVSLNEAKYQEAFATYRSKVINAIQEVEDALVRIEAANKRVGAAEAAERNYEAYFNAFNKKYETGWTNLLDLETVRVTFLSSKETLAAAKLEQVQAWISLYKAVGGEWNKQTNSSKEPAKKS